MFLRVVQSWDMLLRSFCDGTDISVGFQGRKYRVIHKSVKHFKNLQQIDYAKDHGNSYVIERET